MRRGICGVVVLGLGLGCGGGATPPAKPATTAATPDHEVATGKTLTEFQKSRLLGHYSTRDGASGFILDRTGSVWKAKLDGLDKVVTLTASGGPHNTTEYRSDDKSIWLRVDEGGDVLLFQGPKQHEGVDVVRDADANQLR